MARTKSNTTTDHDAIRGWAEERGAQPARVQGTGRGKTDVGMIRLTFPEYSNDEKLEPITWEEFFDEFEKKQLALVYQETTAEGARSNFNKLLSRKTVATKKAGGASKKPSAKKTSGPRTAARSAAKRSTPKKTASKRAGRAPSKTAHKR